DRELGKRGGVPFFMIATVYDQYYEGDEGEVGDYASGYYCEDGVVDVAANDDGDYQAPAEEYQDEVVVGGYVNVPSLYSTLSEFFEDLHSYEEASNEPEGYISSGEYDDGGYDYDSYGGYSDGGDGGYESD
ncbi:hypothetical protein K474DRAFT_1680573, partial [Panus rudis PR-1116 ss-1]